MKAGMFRIPLEHEIDEALGRLNEDDIWWPSGLSGSFIAHECERYVWYKVRHAAEVPISGRTQRYFDMGNFAESLIYDWLERSGYEVFWENPASSRGQFAAYTMGGGLGGYLDGFIRGGMLGSKWHTLSIKTARNAKDRTDDAGNLIGSWGTSEKEGRWWKIHKRGVFNAAIKYWGQDQLYLGCLREPYDRDPSVTNWQHIWRRRCAIRLHGGDGPHEPLPEVPSRCLFVCLNLDTTQIHAEIFEYVPLAFTKLRNRALRVYRSKYPPERVQEHPQYYPCGWCDYQDLCFAGRPMRPNCRTCTQHRVILPGERPGVERIQWLCEHHGIKCPDEPCEDYDPIREVVTF